MSDSRVLSDSRRPNEIESLMNVQKGSASPAKRMRLNSTYFRCVSRVQERKKPTKHCELLRDQEREAGELANIEMIRIQTKKKIDGLNFFKRKISLESSLLNPTVVAPGIAGRNFDSQFAEAFNNGKLSTAASRLKKIMLGDRPVQIPDRAGETNKSASLRKARAQDFTLTKCASGSESVFYPSPEKPKHKSFKLSTDSPMQFLNDSSMQRDASRDCSVQGILRDYERKGVIEQRAEKKPRNLSNEVLSLYRARQKKKLVGRMTDSYSSAAGKKQTIIGSSEAVHVRKQLDQAISEDERNRVSEFMTNKWINELVYPTYNTDMYGQKVITQEVSSNIAHQVRRRHLDQTLDKTLRYNFYRGFDANSYLKYSKDYELNLIFKRMHKDVASIGEIREAKAQICAKKGPACDEEGRRLDDSGVFNQPVDEQAARRALRIGTSLSKSTIPGMITFELVEKVAHKFAANAQHPQRCEPVRAGASWARLVRKVEQVIDYKHLTSAALEDILTFDLLRCVHMPPYKTIGIFDSVKASSACKYRAICTRDRLLKFALDSDGQTPLIKAVEASTPEFISEILADHQPVNHVDKVVSGHRRGARLLSSTPCGEAAARSSSSSSPTEPRCETRRCPTSRCSSKSSASGSSFSTSKKYPRFTSATSSSSSSIRSAGGVCGTGS